VKQNIDKIGNPDELKQFRMSFDRYRKDLKPQLIEKLNILNDIDFELFCLTKSVNKFPKFDCASFITLSVCYEETKS
jgi:hypothetical protein